MKIKSARDFWAGLLFLVAGIVFAVAASNDRLGPECAAAATCASSLGARFAQVSSQPGPGFVPLGLALVLALLGAIVLFKSLTIESEGGEPIGRVAWRPLLAIGAAIVAFAVLIEPAGLVVASIAVVVISSLASDRLALARHRDERAAADARRLAGLRRRTEAEAAALAGLRRLRWTCCTTRRSASRWRSGRRTCCAPASARRWAA